MTYFFEKLYQFFSYGLPVVLVFSLIGPTPFLQAKELSERSISFNSGEEVVFNLLGAEVKTDPDSTKGDQVLVYQGNKDWVEFFQSVPTQFPFVAKATYQVSFDYKLLVPQPKGGGLYFLMRSKTGGKQADRAMTLAIIPKDRRGTFTNTFTLGDFKDYYMIIGYRKEGEVSVKNIKVESVEPEKRTPTLNEKLTLVWSDEFSVEGAPDPKKWQPLKGFRTKDEQQYYTDKPENLRVENGNLVMEARKEKIANEFVTPNKDDWRGNARAYGQYTSGYVDTSGRFNFTYGRVEVRAKIPDGSGMWPAIWGLGEWSKNNKPVSWPNCGEIDIMEYIGVEPKIRSTTHFSLKGQHASKGSSFDAVDPHLDFHLYSMEWTKDKIYFFYDNTFIGSFETQTSVDGDENPFQKPFDLILNLAVGGWGGPVDEKLLPRKFLVDYVRVYQGDIQKP
jgi:beta-glucanase (GH16 family)